MTSTEIVRRTERIPAAGVVLDADVSVPESPRGAVLFAHGSGSGRHSPRNRYVADVFGRAGLVTVLADLLTPEEEQVDLRTAALRFDIERLAERVTALTDRVAGSESFSGLGIGLFGASTGAAAAVFAAASRPGVVRAVVSRGGRPDLARPVLREVHQPTLLLVGGQDPLVLELNRQAARELGGEARLVVIPGATHLFEEPGALEKVAGLARDWFLRHLPADPPEQR
jgi:dienelactone hydrolase